MRLILLAIGLVLCVSVEGDARVNDVRPNIIWIVVEDMSCHFGFQGEKLVSTPHVNRLAKEGVVFRNAYVTSPVCSTSRSAMITGMYQTTIGAHHHRSSRGKLKIRLPKGVKTVPEMFREAGYYTCNVAFDGRNAKRWNRPGKEDYNFVYERGKLYDGADWSGRKKGQPFFAQIQLRGGKFRNVAKWHSEVRGRLQKLVDPKDVKLPPYYPDGEVFRKDWADYLNAVQHTDYEVGLIMGRLKREGLLGNTVVFFLTDHGVSHARGKQFLYDEGAKVPFVVWAGSPEVTRSARLSGLKVVRDDLIVHIDMSATSMEIAGIGIPKWMQGRSLFGDKAKRREYVVTARDRCDETVDRIRAVRKGKYKYVRNYYPERPYLQPCAYKDKKAFMGPLRALFAAGKLDALQSLHLAERRSKEELYDLEADPFEVRNLVGEAGHTERLKWFRERLDNWVVETGDRGRIPESDAMYESDMKVYVDGQKRRKNWKNARQIEKNIALMKRWKAEGK